MREEGGERRGGRRDRRREERGEKRWEEAREGEERWVPVRYPVRGQVTTDCIIITTVVLVLGWTDRRMHEQVNRPIDTRTKGVQ